MLQYLAGLSGLFGPLRLFESITFRAGLGLALGFFLTVLAGPAFIRRLRRRSVTEDMGKDSDTLAALHAGKAGTPTMGGALVLGATALTMLLTCDPANPFVWLALAVLLGYGALGVVDDWMKLRGLGRRGLTKGQKLLGQFALAILTAAVVAMVFPGPGPGSSYTGAPQGGAGGAASSVVAVGEDGGDGADRVGGAISVTTPKPPIPRLEQIVIPFTKWAAVQPDLGAGYYLLFVLTMVACSNAVNLTDGLDGLASGCTIMVAVSFAILAYVVGNGELCRYFRIPYVAGSGELAIVLLILVGTVMGFLWFNAHPAEVFLGDTGSLALGALLAYVALVIKHELVLVLVGGVFVAEAVSVVLQVASFRLTGRRIFRCAPLHHHMEFAGWHENKVVVRFWMIGAVLAAMGLVTLKLH